MAGLRSPLSNPIILHHILRPPPPARFRTTTTVSLHGPPHLGTSSSSSFTSLSSRSLVLFPSSSLSLSSNKLPLLPPPQSLSTSQPTLLPEIKEEYDEDDDEFEVGNEDFESEEEEEEEEAEEEIVGQIVERDSSSSAVTRGKEMMKMVSMTVKEKKELASYAHSLGKKLKSQQVGKSGVTDSVAAALVETLEANELLKLKIHNSCPGDLDDVVKQLEKSTGSVVVGQIGRTVILYRPSLTMLKAEEKREQARRVFRRKPLTFKPPSKAKWQPRTSGRGRRGSSRFLSSS